MGKNVKHYIKKHISSNPVVVEIGAHYGEDTVDFLKVLNPSHLYCFEPDPRNINIFKKYIKDERVSLFEYAISNKNEEGVDFYQGYKVEIKPKIFKKYHWIDKKDYINMKLNASGASSLKTGHPLVENANVIKVTSMRLDSWAKDYNVGYIDFLWIDVQGAENEVVNGFGKLSNNIDAIWIEFGEKKYNGAMGRKETINLLSDIDFILDNKFSDKKEKGNLLFWRKK